MKNISNTVHIQEDNKNGFIWKKQTYYKQEHLL